MGELKSVNSLHTTSELTRPMRKFDKKTYDSRQIDAEKIEVLCESCKTDIQTEFLLC